MGILLRCINHLYVEAWLFKNQNEENLKKEDSLTNEDQLKNDDHIQYGGWCYHCTYSCGIYNLHILCRHYRYSRQVILMSFCSLGTQLCKQLNNYKFHIQTNILLCLELVRGGQDKTWKEGSGHVWTGQNSSRQVEWKTLWISEP